MYSIGEDLVEDHMEAEEDKLCGGLEVRTLKKNTRIERTSTGRQKQVQGQ